MLHDRVIYTYSVETFLNTYRMPKSSPNPAGHSTITLNIKRWSNGVGADSLARAKERTGWPPLHQSVFLPLPIKLDSD